MNKIYKKTENTRVDILSKKPGYKEKQKLKDLFIFRKNKNNLILNKQQLVFITRINSNPFIDQIKIIYKDNIIIEQIP
jgi:hypothetical protein